MSEIEYRITLLGESGVGKEIIMKTLLGKDYDKKQIATIGVTRKILKLNIDIDKNGKKEKQNFNVYLFDTPGQERFRSITDIFLRGLDGVIMLYNIQDLDSFNRIETWIESIRESIKSNNKVKYDIFLIGNKSDLKDGEKKEIEVTEEVAIKLCKEYEVTWGGEHNLKDMDINQLTELIEGFVKEIYKNVGENSKRKKYLEVKEKKCICY